MPFDAPTEVKAEIRILDRMEEILSTPEMWCKEYYMDQHGAHCLLGAAEVACGGVPGRVNMLERGDERMFRRIEALLEPMTEGDVAGFNDMATTTHADILNLIDKARLKILGGT